MAAVELDTRLDGLPSVLLGFMCMYMSQSHKVTTENVIQVQQPSHQLADNLSSTRGTHDWQSPSLHQPRH